MDDFAFRSGSRHDIGHRILTSPAALRVHKNARTFRCPGISYNIILVRYSDHCCRSCIDRLSYSSYSYSITQKTLSLLRLHILMYCGSSLSSCPHRKNHSRSTCHGISASKNSLTRGGTILICVFSQERHILPLLDFGHRGSIGFFFLFQAQGQLCHGTNWRRNQRNPFSSYQRGIPL